MYTFQSWLARCLEFGIDPHSQVVYTFQKIVYQAKKLIGTNPDKQKSTNTSKNKAIPWQATALKTNQPMPPQGTMESNTCFMESYMFLIGFLLTHIRFAYIQDKKCLDQLLLNRRLNDISITKLTCHTMSQWFHCQIYNSFYFNAKNNVIISIIYICANNLFIYLFFCAIRLSF